MTLVASGPLLMYVTLCLLRSGSGKTVSNVIIDSQNSDNEDDEQFVVEAAPQLTEMSEIEMVSSPEGLFSVKMVGFSCV